MSLNLKTSKYKKTVNILESKFVEYQVSFRNLQTTKIETYLQILNHFLNFLWNFGWTTS